MSFGRWLRGLFSGGGESSISTPALGHVERYDPDKRKGVILLQDGRALRFRHDACRDFDPGHAGALVIVTKVVRRDDGTTWAKVVRARTAEVGEGIHGAGDATGQDAATDRGGRVAHAPAAGAPRGDIYRQLDRPSDPTRPTEQNAFSDAVLDASDFAPLTHADFRDAALTQRFQVAGAWFGNRKRIPRAELAGVRLIDQAMVGQGIVSAERLAEIHTIGAEMDRLRPSPEVVGIRGEQAVAADRAERQRRKEEKRRQAADRRAAREQEIADRRQHDIVFIGRGVSSGLADRRCNVELLRSRGLPVMATPKELADVLGLTVGQLRWLAFDSEASAVKHYVELSVPKRSGGQRLLSMPMPMLMRCQRVLFDQVLSRLHVHSAAHGFVPGRSTVTNAESHVGARILVNVDLKDFFPSIGVHRVRRALEGLGYSPAVATLIALLCTARPTRTVMFNGRRYFVAVGERGLPQGACTSPALSNLVCQRLDARFGGLARKLDFRYTRYADDISFSSVAPEAEKLVGYVLARLRHITADEGFSLNQKKTRVMRGNVAQRVTGLTVNDRLGVPRAHVRRLRAILNRARYEGLEAQNRQGQPHFRAWLLGHIAYVTMVDPKRGQALLASYRELSPPG